MIAGDPSDGYTYRPSFYYEESCKPAVYTFGYDGEPFVKTNRKVCEKSDRHRFINSNPTFVPDVLSKLIRMPEYHSRADAVQESAWEHLLGAKTDANQHGLRL